MLAPKGALVAVLFLLVDLCSPLLTSLRTPTSALLGSSRMSGLQARRVSDGVQMKAVADVDTSLQNLKVYELKSICRAKGLKVSGRKAELIERIAAASTSSTNAKPKQPKPKKRRTQRASNAPSPPPRSQKGTREQGRPLAHDFVVHDDDISESSVVFPEVLVDVGGSQGPEVLDSKAARKEARRQKRRQKLSQYFQEEYAKVDAQPVGQPANSLFQAEYKQMFRGLEQQAGPAYAQAMRLDPVEEISIQGQATISFTLSPGDGTADLGPRLGWCKDFDMESGVGVVVDLLDHVEASITRPMLQVSEAVPPDSRGLYKGEFVEYCLGGDDGGALAVTTIHGIQGWPLMCDTLFENIRKQSGEIGWDGGHKVEVVRE